MESINSISTDPARPSRKPFSFSQLANRGDGAQTDSSVSFLPLDSLAAILAQRTTRQQLADALALAAKCEPIPADWEVFGSPLGAELHKALSRPDWQRKVRAGRGGSTGCAFEHYAFSKYDAAAYARLRVARCIHCKRFTVNVDP